MFKKFWKLMEKHEETEKKQQEIIKKQYVEIVKLKTILSSIELITKLNRVGTGMADIYLNEIKELVKHGENDN